MNSSRRKLCHLLERLSVFGVLCIALLMQLGTAQANEWEGMEPIEPIEPIASERVLVAHPFRTPSKSKTWIVERTTWPNPGLLRKIDPGVVVRVIEDGIHHNGEWLRVETIDQERTRGLAMAHLLIPARDEDVRKAFQAEQRAIQEALAAAATEQQRLTASAKRVVAQAQLLESNRLQQLQLRVQPLQLESNRLQRLQMRIQPLNHKGPEGMELAAQAFKAAVQSMKGPVPRSSVREVQVPGAPAALVVPSTPSSAPRAVTLVAKPVVTAGTPPAHARPQSHAGAATPAQAASALANPPPQGASAPSHAGAVTPAQAASAPPLLAPVPAQPSPSAAAQGATENLNPTFLQGAASGVEPVLAIGQTDPRTGMEVSRAMPSFAWGRILLFIMLLVGAAAGLMHYNEVRRERSSELVTLSSVALAGDSSLSLVKAQHRTLVVGTTPQGVQLVTDLGGGDDGGQATSSFLNDFLVPSMANSRPAPLSRLLGDDQKAPLAPKSEHVRRLAAAKKKLFGAAV